MRVQLGSERLTTLSLLRGRRVGVVCNPASIDHDFMLVADRLATLPSVRLTAIFGPQHGFQSDVQENMIETGHTRDRRRGVPVYSLYSETREPTPDMLREVDVLVIDLQDVGTRIYTYIYTMANCLKAAAAARLPVVVCDRPNPIGGVTLEGPMLEPGYESFVGLYPIPMRHAMTIGELAGYFNARFAIGAELTVLPMEGWRREMYHDDTDVPWVMPSPNLPTLDSAVVYPGTVLFEGTSLSEGRGTTRPFEIVGAPGISADELAGRMNARRLPGAHFRATTFEPTFHKHARTPCGGCQIHVIAREAFRPVLTGAALLATVRELAPDAFTWRDPPYEYEYEKLPFDILAGSSGLRKQLESGLDPKEIADSWTESVASFAEERQRYLLYRT